MPLVKLTAYFKSPLTAVLYQHEVAGVWVDIALDKKGELELTVTNAPMGEAAENRPEKQIDYLKGHSVAQLYEHINTYVDNNVSNNPITPDNFREFFEGAYKKDMMYKARNGGISFTEFLRHKEEFGKKIAAKDVREAFVITKVEELEQWHYVAINEYLSTLPDKEQIDNEYELFIVPFRTDAEAFIRYLEDNEFIDDDEEENFSKIFKEETDTFKLFDKLNEGRSPDLRAILINESSYPLKLKIYKRKLPITSWPN